TAPALALRPQLLGMVLLAVTLVLVTVRRTHARLFYLVPVVVAVWANVHGSFFLGPVVLGLAWVEDVHERVPSASRTLMVAIVAAVVAVGIALLPVWRATDPVLGAPSGVLTDAPSGLTAALRATARPGDRAFNPQPWGSWFEFAIPELPVAIDSRIELFPVET